MNAHIIYENEISKRVFLNQEAIQAAESAFAKFSTGKVVMPPVMQIVVEEFKGQACVKSSYMKGEPFFVVKLASIFSGNALNNLPSSSGLMLLINAETGVVDTVLLDNGYLTAIRTAAAGAVAAKYLSNADASTVALIGAGNQARLQLKALCLVRNIDKVLVWSHSRESAEKFSRSLSRELDVSITNSQDIESMVKKSDIAITTTPSRTPLIQADWLQPGTHLTAVGADAPGKVELHPQCLIKANYYVCDSREQCKKLGEWSAAQAAGFIDKDIVAIELGDVIT